jgi:hypothetical protein
MLRAQFDFMRCCDGCWQEDAETDPSGLALTQPVIIAESDTSTEGIQAFEDNP